MGPERTPLLAIVGILASGCAGRAVPPPEQAVERYVAAVERGDAEALHGMMTESSRRALSREAVVRLVGEQRNELREHARALSDRGRTIETRALVRNPDGEVVALVVEDGAFRIDAASGLPALARTPAEALGQLRTALARRSYPGIVRVLTPRTRAELEQRLRSLVDGLVEPEGLSIEISGDEATATVPGGHRVKLRREDGAWHVDDFD